MAQDIYYSYEMMEKDLQITIKGIADEETANKIGLTILEAVKAFEELDQNIDFRRMHQIIVTSDFANELRNLSRNPNEKDSIAHTNEEYALGVAQVIPIYGEGGFRFVPVIDARIAANFAQDKQEGYNSEEFRTILHLLHHELCHVHDNNKKCDAIKIMTTDNAKDSYMISLGDKIWNEYIANFLSCSTVTKDSIDMASENLIGAIKRTKETIDKEIYNYRTHANLNELLSIFERHGHFLVKSAAYMLGYIDGLDKSLQDLSFEASQCLIGSYFEKTWDGIHTALKNMRGLYPDRWKDLGVYKQLTNILEGYYSDMGMNLSNRNDGQLFIDIPFRSENTPNL